MDDDAGPRRPEPTEAELATYVAEACRDLRTVSDRASFRMLNYLLDQVRAEAERVARAAQEDGRR